MKHARLAVALSGALLVGCEGTGGVILEADPHDAGPMSGGDHLLRRDAGPFDLEPPQILETSPANGEVVESDASVTVLFSEPMRDTGSLEVVYRGAFGEPTRTWSESARILTITFPEPLPTNGRVRVTVGGDHADLAGNPLGEAHALMFDVARAASGPGDTCADAIRLTPNATHAVRADRPFRTEAPSCIELGGITWYRYTTTERLGIVRADGVTTAAALDVATDRELRCGDDTSRGLPVLTEPGTEVCIALASSSSVEHLTIEEIPYDGPLGRATSVAIEVPTTLRSTAWMAAQGTRLFRAGGAGTTSDPARIDSAATEGGEVHSHPTPGLSVRGGAAVARPEGLYVLSSSASPTSGSRLFRVTDDSGSFLPTPEPVDVIPEGFTYPGRSFDALAWDGTHFVVATGQSTTSQNPSLGGECCVPVSFYAIPTDGTPPVRLGENDILAAVSAIAADASRLYVYGRVAGGFEPPSTSRWIESIYRLGRDKLEDPAQEPVALVTGLELSDANGALHVDSTDEASLLYFRLYGGARAAHGSDVWLVAEPGLATPRWAGPLWRASTYEIGTGLAYDPSGPTLWLLDRSATPDAWVRLD